MSAKLIDFPSVQSPEPSVPERRPEHVSESEYIVGHLTPELFFKIFCSYDERLQDLALEHFLLECD
jgi:hypothetical protein